MPLGDWQGVRCGPARAAIYAYDAQTRQASDQPGGTADLKKSLQQEQERANRLEQDLAAARRDVETQTAAASNAGKEATRFKQAAESGTADLRKSLEEERDRASRMEQDLAAARREAALASKAGEEVAQLKRAADALRQSLQQERDKAERLTQDLSRARTATDAYDAQASQAGDERRRVNRPAESSVIALRRSLVQEWEREARLQQDLAGARREVETQTALMAKFREEANQRKAGADAGARRDVGTQAGLATKAGAEAILAQPVTWTTFTIPETGTSADFPASIFTERAGRPDGYGQRFKTADGRATLTIQSAPNALKDSPAAFLARRHPPAQIQYKRITSRFFCCVELQGR